MMCLGLDAAMGACSAALADETRVIARLFQPMRIGHAEAIAPMVEALMREAGLAFAAIDRIAVTTGPGTFTGQRIGLAFARGLALALKIPCVGVTTLEAIGAAAATEHPGRPVLVASDARRGEVYAQRFAADGTAIDGPSLVPVATAAAWARDPRLVLAGTAAPLLDAGGATIATETEPDAKFVARLGLGRDPHAHPPAPLYLREADAKLPGPLKPLPPQRMRT